jgi:hypothetical protein
VWLTGSHWQQMGSCSVARHRRSGAQTPALVGTLDHSNITGNVCSNLGILGSPGMAQAADGIVGHLAPGCLTLQNALPEGVCLVLCQQ